MQYKFAFIILHYNENSLKDTHACIRSILDRFSPNDFRIVVVDNGSGDRSAPELHETYDDVAEVDILETGDNLGFARGNNAGCRHAYERYRPDFFIVVNNDTEIIQDDFLERVDRAYEDTAFDLLGPYILDREKRPQNPLLKPLLTMEQVEGVERRLQQDLDRLEALSDAGRKRKDALYRLERLLRRLLFPFFAYKKKFRMLRKLSREYKNDAALHGAALIFSGSYYERYREAFYNGTFLYHEEDILYYRVIRDCLTSVYDPRIRILHKEDGTTDSVLGRGVGKRIFILKKRLESLEILKKIMQEGF